MQTSHDVQNWLPATFRERGVAVPFTCPALAGARIRLLERRVDVIIPHPGGGRGVYVLALSSLAEFCVPTLHDLRLAARLAALPALSPASVRGAALAVAAEGAAGRAAAAAAAAIAALDQRRQAKFTALLLVSLDSGAQAHASLTPQAAMADTFLLAGELARSPLDGPLCPHGPAIPGRGQALLGAVAALAAEAKAWGGEGGNRPAAAQIVHQVVSAATAMHAAGRLLLQAGNHRLGDLVGLRAEWAGSPAGVSAALSQPDWLLDGWEHVCLLWGACGSNEDRAAALAEIVFLLPPVPAEADAWLPREPALLAALHARTLTAQGAGAAVREASHAVGLTARNERLRSLAA